jgi:hypothetical protein
MFDDDELNGFKRKINLAELAASYGYVVVRKESCKTSLVMVNPAAASKIIVATNSLNGHGMFFEVHGNASGSVMDFVMYREGCNLGKARIKLREYLGHPRLNFPIITKEFEKPLPTTRDRAGAVATWQKGQEYNGGYLEGRGLSSETIAAFSDQIRLIASPDGKHHNVAFRHDDQAGLTGWEVKNRGFTGFAGGGGKALFSCQIGEEGSPSRIVICESAIDAMSYYQLSGKPGLYVSFAGGLSDVQKDLLRELLNGNPQAKVVTATDADRDGEKYAVFISSIRPDAVRARPCLRDRPGVTCKDWNDVLMERPASPTAVKGAGRQIAHLRSDQACELSPGVTPANWSTPGKGATH